MTAPIHASDAPAAGGFRWTAFSETGVRERNEDRWGQGRSAGGVDFWVVADGMGGHEAGDVAATVAVDAFLLAAAGPEDPESTVRHGISAARTAVMALAAGKGTAAAPSSTLVALAVKGTVGFVCHAGDSVLFQFRCGRLIHHTQEHNVRVLKQIVGGAARLPAHLDPDASLLLRSLGQPLAEGAEDVVSALRIKPGDLVLLCSDGVAQHIPTDNPGIWAATARDARELCDLAHRTVLAAEDPHQDNYTAVAISIEGVSPSKPFTRWTLLAGAIVATWLAATRLVRRGKDQP